MRGSGRRGRAGPLRRTVIVLAVLLVAPVLSGFGATAAGAGTGLAIAVSGNHFVNGAGQTVRLLGVNAPSTEYACEQGWGYAQQPLTTATARAIAAWHADAVRVPLNEDCWLGLNGQPSYGTQAGYQQAIESWVSDLHSAGLYVILDLHWSAPGTLDADGQRPMPDDHAAAFWTSVATAFKNDPAIVFDAFNEPYSPAADGDSGLAVSWSCWRNGGCPVPVAADGTRPDDGDTYANDLSGWLSNEPTDPDHQLAASFHNYYGEACDTTSCWGTTIAGVAAHVPVVTGEFDQGYDCASPPSGPAGLTTFDTTYMRWADATGVSYLAWGWWVLGNTSSPCSSLGGGSDNYALISEYTGTAVAPDGLNLFQHLASLSTATGLAVVTSSLPAGSPKVRYSARLLSNGGSSRQKWSVVSGHLPTGLHLHGASGSISGRPRTSGTFPFTVEVRVKVKVQHLPATWNTATRALSITIS